MGLLAPECLTIKQFRPFVDKGVRIRLSKANQAQYNLCTSETVWGLARDCFTGVVGCYLRILKGKMPTEAKEDHVGHLCESLNTRVPAYYPQHCCWRRLRRHS